MANLGGGTIKGMDKAQKRFRDMAKKFPHVTKAAMNEAVIMIEERAMANVTNAGPFLLNVGKTGVLRVSIHHVVKQRGGDFTVGTVGIPQHVPYGRTHELGFTGNQRVKAHSRTISQAFGKPITTQTHTVRAHTRFMRLKKRPWLSGAYKLRKRAIERRFERITQELLRAAG